MMHGDGPMDGQWLTKDLGHAIENVLNMVRKQQLIPTHEVAGVLLTSSDLLTQMLRNIDTSGDVDITAALFF